MSFYFTEMCSGLEAGSYLRLIFVSLNSRLESNKEEEEEESMSFWRKVCGLRVCIRRVPREKTLKFLSRASLCGFEEGSYLRLIDLCITQL